MWLRLLGVISALLVTHPPLILAEEFRLGQVYADPGAVSVVVEVPPGVTPEASDFRLVAEGELIATGKEIKAFRDSGRGLAMILCIDVSGTMKGEPLEETKGALLALLAKVRPEDRIALVAFADEDRIESSFEERPEHLAEAVRNLQARGKQTRLYQAVYKALDMFQGVNLPARRRVIVISDGKDEGSVEGAISVIAKSKNNPISIPIDTVGRGKIAPQYVEALRGLSLPTGGLFIHARPDRLALTDALDRLYEDLLATRSLVVSFTYESDASAPMIANATLQFQQPGQAVTVKIPVDLPRGKKQPEVSPQEPAVPGWLWLLVVVVLLGVGFMLGKRRASPRDTGTTEPVPSTAEAPSPTPHAGERDQRPSPPPVTHGQVPKTQVGGPYFTAPMPGQPMATLRAISGPLEGQQFAVEKDVFHIGAGAGNDLTLAEDDYLSADHAYLRFDQGTLFIFDNGSRNGTFVNQQQVNDTGLPLSLGDHIQVGMSTFEVVKASP